MADRVYPISDVKMYETQRQYVQKYDGFGHNELLRDLYLRGDLTMTPSPGAQWPQIGRGATAPGGMLIEGTTRSASATGSVQGGLNAMIARPHLDISQSIGLGHFTPLAGDWLQLKNMGLQNEVKLYQYNGAPNLTTGIESNFSLPTNPMFGVSLYRAHVCNSHNWSEPPYTEIHWSVGAPAHPYGAQEWAIAIPYGEPMLLLRYENGTWEKVSDSDEGLDMPIFEGMARGQRVFLWFAVIRGHIVISTDGFVDHLWTYSLHGEPGSTSAELIHSGKVAFWHNAGQWMFSFHPIAMHGCLIQSPPFSAAYDTTDSTGELILTYRRLPVIDDEFNPLHQATVEDNTDEVPGLNPDERTWQATLTPYIHAQQDVGTDPDTGETVDFRTAVSPELYSVQIGQYPELEAGDAPASEDLTPRTISVTGRQRGSSMGTTGSAAHYRLALDNQDGSLADIQEYRRLSLKLGWHLDNGSDSLSQVASGYLVEPQLDIAPGGESLLHVELLDPMVRLRDEKADGRSPIFDDWPVKAAFEWVLDRCGLDRSELNLEDTGTPLSMGSPEEELWRVEPGRPWIDFLHQMAAFDHGAAFFFDHNGHFVKACPYCRQLRTAEDVLTHDGTEAGSCDCTVSWELYTRSNAAPDPNQPGEILRLSKLRESLAGTDYNNYIMVAGVDADGHAIRSVAYDADSLYDPASSRYVGWRKMEVYEVRGICTQAQANQMATELMQQLAPEPEHVSLVTPLEPGLKIGQVLRVNGGEAVGVNGAKYRICEVEHHVHKAPNHIAYSTIKAKDLPAGT